nr:MAG TPA: hypothetical protein [Caudoviricetes sp.]
MQASHNVMISLPILMSNISTDRSIVAPHDAQTASASLDTLILIAIGYPSSSSCQHLRQSPDDTSQYSASPQSDPTDVALSATGHSLVYPNCLQHASGVPSIPCGADGYFSKKSCIRVLPRRFGCLSHQSSIYATFAAGASSPYLDSETNSRKLSVSSIDIRWLSCRNSSALMSTLISGICYHLIYTFCKHSSNLSKCSSITPLKWLSQLDRFMRVGATMLNCDPLPMSSTSPEPVVISLQTFNLKRQLGYLLQQLVAFHVTHHCRPRPRMYIIDITFATICTSRTVFLVYVRYVTITLFVPGEELAFILVVVHLDHTLFWFRSNCISLHLNYFCKLWAGQTGHLVEKLFTPKLYL